MAFTKKEIDEVFKTLGLENENARTKKLFNYTQNDSTKDKQFKFSEGTSSIENENAILE